VDVWHRGADFRFVPIADIRAVSYGVGPNQEALTPQDLQGLEDC